jgi:DNA-binding transcriptional LysR family regulator
MDIRQLKYFEAVAETGHMTRAASQLGIQQPPLSQQIKLLETQMGAQLFHRHPKGMALTDIGKLFQAEVRKLLQEVAAMEQRMARLASGAEGTLAIGFTSSAAAHEFMPQVLRECRRSHPDIRLELSENNAADITEAVASSRLHCGLLRVPVARPEGVEFETLFREPVMVALPVGHGLLSGSGGKPRSIKLRELQNENLILVRKPGAPGLYGNLLALLEEQGFRPTIEAEVDRMMTNLNLVAAGVGISVVPASMKGTHSKAIVYCPLAGSAKLDAPMTLAYRKSECAGPTRVFIDLTRKLAGRLRARQAVR